jgi:hypothetical protein
MTNSTSLLKFGIGNAKLGKAIHHWMAVFMREVGGGGGARLILGGGWTGDQGQPMSCSVAVPA